MMIETEERIENLVPGDEITVKLRPNGSTYRAGYQIAFGTPTFDGLPVFEVATYGAVGDGVTDDMAAIRAAPPTSTPTMTLRTT